jgi:hypothetical protein
MTNLYAQPEYPGREGLLASIARDDVEQLRSMIVAVALYEEDLGFAEAACTRLSAHTDETIRGNAVLGFGHLARLFGSLREESLTIVKHALEDESGYVRGQANAAAADLAHFLGVDVRLSGSEK